MRNVLVGTGPVDRDPGLVTVFRPSLISRWCGVPIGDRPISSENQVRQRRQRDPRACCKRSLYVC